MPQIVYCQYFGGRRDQVRRSKNNACAVLDSGIDCRPPYPMIQASL